MTKCDFLVFQNFNHCIKGSIPLSSLWIITLNTIHALDTKLTITPIERNIRVRIFKPLHIIGLWADTNSLMNCSLGVMEIITDIQNPYSESMHNCDSNVDLELTIMWYWTIRLIKVNGLNLITPIFIVKWNKFPCIRGFRCIITVDLLDTCSNEKTEELCFTVERFDWYRSQNNFNIFVLVIFHR